MSIVGGDGDEHQTCAGDDGDDRQTRVARMIEEFRQAQSRRRAKGVTVNGGAQVAALPRDVHAQAEAAGPTTTPRASP